MVAREVIKTVPGGFNGNEHSAKARLEILLSVVEMMVVPDDREVMSDGVAQGIVASSQ